jgi:hypothetical protein
MCKSNQASNFARCPVNGLPEIFVLARILPVVRTDQELAARKERNLHCLTMAPPITMPNEPPNKKISIGNSAAPRVSWSLHSCTNTKNLVTASMLQTRLSASVANISLLLRQRNYAAHDR